MSFRIFGKEDLGCLKGVVKEKAIDKSEVLNMPSVHGYNEHALRQLLFSIQDASPEEFANVDQALLMKVSKALVQASTGAPKVDCFEVDENIHNQIDILAPNAPLNDAYDIFADIGAQFVMKSGTGPFSDCKIKSTIDKKAGVKSFEFSLVDHGVKMSYGKKFFIADSPGEVADLIIIPATDENRIGNEAYIIVDRKTDKRVSEVYSKGSASRFSVNYRRNAIRALVRGGNGNYFQGGSCEASSAPLQVAMVVLFNMLPAKVAASCLNELTIEHDIIDVQFSLRSPDIATVIENVYRYFGVGALAEENLYVQRKEKWRHGSPYDFSSPEGILQSGKAIIADIQKRNFFPNEEKLESQIHISELLNL